MILQFSRTRFFHIFDLGNIFENFNQKVPGPRVVSQHDFQAILVFLTQIYFFIACHKKKKKSQKSDFLPFSQKNSILSKIWHQKWIL